VTGAGEPEAPPVLAALTRGRTLGFLGPGPVEVHVRHAAGFAVCIERHLGRIPASILDLGSGAGVPGLVLAERWPDVALTLVESGHRRCAHLRQEIQQLGWSGRVDVLEERAELTARRPELREQVEVVTARSFAAPAVTAEIAAGLVAPGGLLVVSEPPEAEPSRWPTDQLDALGFGPARLDADGDAHFAVFVKTRGAPPDIPRAPGRPGKRPRW
jgi:16S rRNA (guanine527-N7)-methyltransferase